MLVLANKTRIMRQSKLSFPLSVFTGLTLSLAFVLVASVPFGHALEIHHIFSTIDHDGHQHADFDLCQWVQQHTSTSLVWDFPLLAQWSWSHSRLSLANKQIPHTCSSSVLHSRGPPHILFF